MGGGKAHCVFLVLLVLWGRASAHPEDLGHLAVEVRGTALNFTLGIDPIIATQLSGLPAERFMPNTVSRSAALFFASTFGQTKLEVGDRTPCRWNQSLLSNRAGKIRFETTAECTDVMAAWKLSLPFLKRATRSFELVVQTTFAGVKKEFVLSPQHFVIDVTPEKSLPVGGFFRMGIAHIGALPSEWSDAVGWHLPEGIDHILFLLALVLGTLNAKAIVKTVTGFMIGHSLTLALSTLGVLSMPSRWVESAIALSIALVAAETFFLQKVQSRWKIAAAFGAVHGMGFASALSELHLSGVSLLTALLAFNVGVEVGQLILVAMLLPALYALNQFKRLYVISLKSGSFLLMGLGSYWFCLRAFGG